ncbi:MAG: hypothetical protein AAF682_08775 [Planctomycetota bacterium]
MQLRTLAFSLPLLTAAVSAQSLWTIDQSGNVTKHNGPAAGPCSYPLGPLLSFYSYENPGICATPLATGAGAAGDIGLDRVSDELWITDGFIASGYQTFGTPVKTGVDVFSILNAPVTGIDFDPGTGELWVTDGANLGRATITFFDPCFLPTSTSSVPLPLPTGSPATSLSHDPVTDTLWIVDGAGFLTQVEKSGALGPLGSTQVSVTSGCGLDSALTAVAADNAGPAGRVYVTDGTTVAIVDAAAGGGPAATTFYSPFSCYTPPSIPLQGMVIASDGNLFGSTSGGIFPIIGQSGAAIVPNPTFSVELAAANENELAVLAMSTSFSCPALNLFGVPFHLGVSPLLVLATATVPDTGLASVNIPLGGMTPVGEEFFFQWGMIDPLTLAVTSTRGLAVTTGMP